MQVAGHFRAVRRKDRVFSGEQPKPVSFRGSSLDIRVKLGFGDNTPFLLVQTPRKSGSATDRNKFRRRVRMAFLAVLRKRPLRNENNKSFVLWIRPGRSNPMGCRVEYRDIEKQIETALNRLGHP